MKTGTATPVKLRRSRTSDMPSSNIHCVQETESMQLCISLSRVTSERGTTQGTLTKIAPRVRPREDRRGVRQAPCPCSPHPSASSLRWNIMAYICQSSVHAPPPYRTGIVPIDMHSEPPGAGVRPPHFTNSVAAHDARSGSPTHHPLLYSCH